jgi:SAM-dependent methyltransferase
MSADQLMPYEAYELGLRDAARPWRLVLDGVGVRPVHLQRWLDPPAPADETVLERAAEPVLDVGCGPGRHVGELAARGVMALGVDASPMAVRLARARGAEVHEGSIFAQVPGSGTWGSALLLDGNLGIGGDPARLLRRVSELLVPGGSALVELDPPGSPTRRVRARLEGTHGRSGWFPWALVGADGVHDLASRCSLTVHETWEHAGRWFAELE